MRQTTTTENPMKPDVVKFSLGHAEIRLPEAAVRALFIQSLQEGTAPAAPASTLEWSPTLCDGKCVNYAAAEKAVAELGEGWRLPTRRELESIQNLTRHRPCIDTEKFPDTKNEAYWTSTPCAWDSSAVWIVGFGNGGSDGYSRGSNACVRAVRSVPASQ